MAIVIGFDSQQVFDDLAKWLEENPQRTAVDYEAGLKADLPLARSVLQGCNLAQCPQHPAPTPQQLLFTYKRLCRQAAALTQAEMGLMWLYLALFEAGYIHPAHRGHYAVLHLDACGTLRIQYFLSPLSAAGSSQRLCFQVYPQPSDAAHSHAHSKRRRRQQT